MVYIHVTRMLFSFNADEKEKYDPSNFRDAIISSLNEIGYDLEQVLRFAIKCANSMFSLVR